MTRTAPTGPPTGGELVPLAERLRVMQLFRVVAAALIVALCAALPELLAVDAADLLWTTAAWLFGALVVTWAWELVNERQRYAFGGLLVADGVFLAWAVSVTGAATSPLRYLVLLHLIAVALTAPHRASLQLALWHSLLLLLAGRHAQAAGLLAPVEEAGLGQSSSLAHTLVFVAAAWLTTIAAAAFSALNERELRRRRYDLEALAALALHLEQAQSATEVGDRLLDCLVAAFGLRRAVLVDARGDARELLAGRGQVHGAAGAGRSATLERARRERRTLLLTAPHSDAWLEAVLPAARTLVVVPLHGGGRASAVLVVEHDARAGSRIERRLVAMVERFAGHAALALSNAWLLEQLRAVAATDGLTGIANRRTFEAALAAELRRAERDGESVSLVMLDLDHFKSLNDTYGHQVGDDVLRQVARAMAAVCRPRDLAARFGGEEFAVVLPGCAADAAPEIAARLQRAVAASASAVPVTASAGHATFPRDARTADDLVRAADTALYVSKRAGRDRVTAAAAGMEVRCG